MKLTNVPMQHDAFSRAAWHDAKWQHHVVMSLFGDLGGSTMARQNGDILFRVEPDRPAHDGSAGRVLVQSSVTPTVTNTRTTDLDPVLASYRSDQQVRILLRANTVRTINRTNGEGQVRRHRARVQESQLPHWMLQRLDGAVKVPGKATESGERPLGLTHTSGELRRGRAQIITTDFHAIGVVDDPRSLAQLVRTGVGRAKAYGCGMLIAIPT